MWFTKKNSSHDRQEDLPALFQMLISPLDCYGKLSSISQWMLAVQFSYNLFMNIFRICQQIFNIGLHVQCIKISYLVINTGYNTEHLTYLTINRDVHT